MTVEERLEQLKEFAERQGFEVKLWRGETQQEPTASLTLTVSGVALFSESSDGLEVAVARMERALTRLARARSDAYLHEPHAHMGTL